MRLILSLFCNVAPRAVALAVITAVAGVANAATLTSDIPVSGSFNASLSGTGSASLTSASGNFKQWTRPVSFLPGFHVDIGISAPAQTVGISIPTVNPGTMAAGGNVDLTYDNITPGTPETINSIDLDLNGGTNIPFNINIDPLQINTSLGNFNLQLSVAGLITDIDFISNASGSVNGSGVYASPGQFAITVQGQVSGQLVGVPIIGNVNLGTLFTLDPQTLTFDTPLPGMVTLSDLEGGLPPYPNDMLANFAAALPFPIPVPLNLPIAVNESASIGSGQSGFSSLVINGTIDATLNLQDISYNVSGTVPAVLVPEPGSITLAVFGALGMLAVGLRRRRK